MNRIRHLPARQQEILVSVGNGWTLTRKPFREYLYWIVKDGKEKPVHKAAAIALIKKKLITI